MVILYFSFTVFLKGSADTGVWIDDNGNRLDSEFWRFNRVSRGPGVSRIRGISGLHILAINVVPTG